MSASPQPPKTPTQAKTPSRYWLSGLFSSHKKPKSVEDSTNSTGISPRTDARNMKLSLPSSAAATSSSAAAMETSNSLVATTSPAAALVANNTRSFPNSPAVPTVAASYPTKSPWKNQDQYKNLTFSVGTVKPKGIKKKIAAKSPRKKSYRHRPSIVLSQSSRRKTVDQESVSQALQKSSRRIFEPSSQQTKALKNYNTSFKPGKRMLGSQQRASRLPSAEEEEKGEQNEKTETPVEMPEAKRRRKVMFDNEAEEKPIQQNSLGFQTPLAKHMPTKETPFKLPAADTPQTKTPPSSDQKIPPKPVVDRLVKPPYTNFGDDLEYLGEPADGNIKATFKFSYFPNVGNAKNSTERPLYFVPPPPTPEKMDEEKADSDDKEEATQPTKKTKPNTYSCSNCGAENDAAAGECVKCGEKRGWGNTFKKFFENKWKCKICSCQNEESVEECQSCDGLRHGAVSSSSTTTKSTSTTEGAKAPATSGSIGAGGFSFGGTTSGTGASSDTKPTSNFGAPAPAASSSSSGGGAGFTFGGPTPAPAASTGGFPFGGPVPAPAPATTSGSGGFSFSGGAASEASGTGSSGFTFEAAKTDSSVMDSS